MSCLCKRWNIKVNSLWLWWYCVLMLVAEGYLMFRAVHKCKEYNELPWRSSSKPVTELYIYITLIVVSIMCIPFFVITTIAKIGNYANDGIRLGRDKLGLRRYLENAGESEDTSGTCSVFWKHMAPLSNMFHLIAAFALLLPTVLLDARKIQYGFLPTGDVWKTELSFLYASETERPPSFVGSFNSSGLPPIGLQENSVSPEFINYIVALIVLGLRYPSVFWYTNKNFSFLFSFQQIFTTVYYGFAFCGFTVLYKLQINTKLGEDLSLLLSPILAMVLFLLANTFILFSSISIFNYGYQHYSEHYMLFMQQTWPHFRPSAKTPIGCQGYIPHIIATVMMVLIVCCRGAIVYDYVVVYRKTGMSLMLTCIISDCLYMLIWIVLWFAFTVKQTWDFKIRKDGITSEEQNYVYTIHNPHVAENNYNHLARPVKQSSYDPNDILRDAVVKDYPSRDDINQQEPDVQNNPMGVLRKTGSERKSHQLQKVKFEEDIALENMSSPRIDTFEALDLEPTAAPIIPQRRKRSNSDSLSNRGHRHRNGVTKPDRKRFSDMYPHSYYINHPQNLPERTFSENIAECSPYLDPEVVTFPRSETPENTLKRNYRYSIRDKCGKLYCNSQEFNPPPAAQSSPLPLSKTGLPELVLKPITSSNLEVSNQDMTNRMRPESEISDTTSNPLPRPGPRQKSNPTTNNNNNLTKPLPPDPRQLHGNKPTDKKKTRVIGEARDNMIQTPIPHPSEKEIKVVNKKTDIKSRDSGLPSSNETSSNESAENMLCSQV